MPKLFNPALFGAWENWLRVLLMVAIGLCAIHFINKLNARKEG
jgi:hypothetical protein